MRHPLLFIGLLSSTAACGSSSNGDAPTGAGGVTQTAAATGSNANAVGGPTTGGTTQGNTSASASTTSAVTSSASVSGSTAIGGSTGGNATTADATTGDASSGGTTAGNATAGNGSGGATGSGGSTTSTSVGGGQSSAGGVGGSGMQSNCVGNPLPSADPKSAGPFQVTAEKNVGPLAGVLPDPIYGDEQQRFNVYRPSNLADSGYCHPILIWANGYQDNPEPNPPDCIVDSGANRWCGQYLPMVNHLASHGFVVVAPLSTATGGGDPPLPTTIGLDWILEQAEDSSSPYYHRLDTLNIGQLGHSFGGMSTCMTASDPRYRALATICGTRALEGVHTPMLFFCGGQDDQVECDGVKSTYESVTDQPAFFLNELGADHGSWVYTGASGVALSAAAAWFRVHLMDDTANRDYFYGAGCRFCSDNRVQVEQNSLMAD